MSKQPLRTAVVGLGLPGQGHVVRIVAESADFTLVAGCDMTAELREKFRAAYPDGRVYADFDEMLKTEHPDVVVIATGALPRCALTLRALAAGVRGLYLEKPMAVSLGEARRMTAACAEKRVPLIVNHQRRTLPVFRAMRRLIADGAIGELEAVRASCAGDLLSDGTHLVDTVRFLAGDAPATWVAGAALLGLDEPGFTGRRYGHAVERGSWGMVGFQSGLRAEFHVGSLMLPRTHYQFYEAIGIRGRLMRNGDQSPLMIRNETGGWREAAIEAVDGEEPPRGLAYPENYRNLARLVRGETREHPLGAAAALADHEILMAILESARRHERLVLPLKQEVYPVDLMLAEARSRGSAG
jgi:predicted dehydrogenase